MSTLLLGQAFEMPIVPAGKKLVLLAFADAANSEGLTWMALASERGKLDIKTKTSLSIRAVRGHVSELEREGYLERTKRAGKGCVWRVSITAASAGLDESNPADIVINPAESAPKPILNRQEKKKTREAFELGAGKCPITRRDLPISVSVPQWKAWLEMRACRGKKVEPYVADLVLRKLAEIAKAGWHPGDVLDRSTVNAWSDVYEPEAGRVTGVRRILSGRVSEPVGMSEGDKAELIRIAAIDSMPDKLAARREFIARVERRNEASSRGASTDSPHAPESPRGSNSHG